MKRGDLLVKTQFCELSLCDGTEPPWKPSVKNHRKTHKKKNSRDSCCLQKYIFFLLLSLLNKNDLAKAFNHVLRCYHEAVGVQHLERESFFLSDLCNMKCICLFCYNTMLPQTEKIWAGPSCGINWSSSTEFSLLIHSSIGSSPLFSLSFPVHVALSK